jgi:hypothetical protein
MPDEDKLAADLSRANRAQLLWQDELLQEAFEKSEREYVRLWRESVLHDSQGRERLYMALKGLDLVKQNLRSVINSGMLARDQLEHLVKLRKK